MEPNDKKRRRRSTQRKPTEKRAAQIAANLRIPADVWQKCEWAAIAAGVNRPDFIRRTLSDATRNARPPAADDTAVILGVIGRRKDAWLALCAEYGKPIGEVAAILMDLQTKKIFGTAPVVKDGEWHWPVDEKRETA